MNLLTQLGILADHALISWDISPAYTYGLFECRGDMQRVRSKDERYYYFYIDNFAEPAKLFLMERGIRHARVLARITAPQDMIDQCIAEQGRKYKDKTFAINGHLRQWLEEHVLAGHDAALVMPVVEAVTAVSHATGLPLTIDPLPELPKYRLRQNPAIIGEQEIEPIVRQYNFFEKKMNPSGDFPQYLVDSRNLTVTDMVTNLMWQRTASELMSFRKLQKWIEQTNEEKCDGFSDWRLPTIEEALSLLRPSTNDSGHYLHPCFTGKPGFIFTADRRKPGGYWFIDFGRAHVYWAAGTPFAGGFGRLCREC